MSHSEPENPEDLRRFTSPGHDQPDPVAEASLSSTTPASRGGTTDPPATQVRAEGDTARTGDQSSKADTARKEGQQVKDEATEGATHVAEVATDQVQSVASEAGEQAKDLIGQAKSQLAEQAASQQKNLTAWLSSIADELHEMVTRGSADDSAGHGPRPSTDEQPDDSSTSQVAHNAVSEVHGKVQGAVDWLESHEPSELLDEATRFARRRPGAFLAAAAVGGLLAGRFTRGVRDDDSTTAGRDEPAESSTRDRP